MAIDTSIDMAVLDAVMAQTPPAIVRPYVDVNADFDEMQALLVESNIRAEKKLRTWIAKGEASLADLQSAFEKNQVRGHHLDALLRVAEAIEGNAEEFATEMARTEKQARRLLKKLKRYSLRQANIYEQAFEKGFDLAKEEIDARLNAALFFRALRAEHTPDNRIGPATDDPKEFARMLDAAMAS